LSPVSARTKLLKNARRKGKLMNELGYAMGRQALSVVHQVRDSTFSAMGLEWDQLAAVFGGDGYMDAAEFFTSRLPVEEARTFLEMGCGNGLTAVAVALRGCPAVTALDINPAAVENTLRNANRHGVLDRVRAMTSDLFGALDGHETFDLIYWNSPFIEAPADHALESVFEAAIFDPGYSIHRRFFGSAEAHLATGGSIFLGFSNSMGDAALMQQIAGEAGFDGRVYDQQTFTVPPASLGPSPEFVAHADDAGMVHTDFTLLQFRRR
jgi:16S rRNA G1207 methylase RsmC